MAEPVTGSELKVRGFEVPLTTVPAPDHVVNLDGVVGSPASITPANLVGGGIDKMQVLPPAQFQGQQAYIPLAFDLNGQPKQGKADLQSVLAGAGSFYLGPKQFPPATDNFGGPLQVGMTYYNTNDERIYVFSAGLKWTPGGGSYPASVKAYYYTFNVGGTLLPTNGPSTPDAYGNVLSFDVSAGQAAINAVNVYINGALLVNGVDYLVHEGGAGGDYITLATEYCTNSVAVVQIFATGDTVFVPNAIQANTTGWIFNGTNTTFPLINMQGEPIFASSANNILLSFNGTILQPNVEFTLAGTNIVFLTPPVAGSETWAIVGVPVGGGAIRTISPSNFGGVGDGENDDTLAVTNAIQRMIATGATLDISGGKWRITGPLPQFGPCNIEGLGSGEIYVDYDPEGVPIFDCFIPNRGVYNVAAIAEVLYDFNGAYTASSLMTKITIALGAGQTMPKVGEIGKLVCTGQIPGVETGDNIGEHIYVVAADTANLYVPRRLYDTFSGTIQLLMLDQTFGVTMNGLRFTSNWSKLISEDWLFEYIRVTGAVRPRITNTLFRDGVQGLTLAGTWKANTRGMQIGRMRNATASEVPGVPGYGIVDAGSYMSSHSDVLGEDCRHVYTTISPDAASWDKVAWGRTIKPSIDNGKGTGCSAAAFDTHSDCLEPVFNLLDVDGGYFGENSAGAGIQFRGIRGRVMNSQVRNCAVGYEMYKQFAGEANGHTIENCTYFGVGTPIRAEHADTLTGADARQVVRIGNFKGSTTGQLGLDLLDADVVLFGQVLILHTGTQTSPRAAYLRAASTIRSEGRGTLVHDVTGMVSPAQAPRLIVLSGPNCAADGLVAHVRAGANVWQSVVADDDVAAAAVAAGAFRVECNCDVLPAAASGGYSLAGAGNLLPAGALLLRLTRQGGITQAARTTAFSLVAGFHSQTLLCNGTFTVTVPAATILGPDFRCTIVSVVGGGVITLDGPGGTNPTIAAGSKAELAVVGSSVAVLISALTVL